MPKARESVLERMARMTAFDQPFLRSGALLAGMDEVGRGPLAGPVVVCCLVLPSDSAIPGVNDSKKCSEKRREALFDTICAEAIAAGIGYASPEEIDGINILNATKVAAVRAFDALPMSPDDLLVDALRGLAIDTRQHIVVHGDQLSYRIAAASIVAKVTRDRLMRDYDAIFPQYGFAQHKGYGTSEHIAALRHHGPCPIHRRSFIGHFV